MTGSAPPIAVCFGWFVVGVALAATRPADATADTPDGVTWASWLERSDTWAEPGDSTVAGPPELLPPLSPPRSELPTSDPASVIDDQPVTSPQLFTPPPRDASPVGAIGPIASVPGGRIVRYDVPLDDHATHEVLEAAGVPGELVAVPIKAGAGADSTASRYAARLRTFFSGSVGPPTGHYRFIRYDVPADALAVHTLLAGAPAVVVEPSMLRQPEVRFFQPKARVYVDLKQENDAEFDLFTDGSVLASLDVVELYFPMPLLSERFARTFGRQNRLAGLGWRVGGTVGVGISTALTDNGSDGVGSPITTLAAGVRYEFPLGRPSQEVLATGDFRLDQRTRVGVEGGVQGGLSTNESLSDRTDLGLYLGIVVNTPWGG